MLCFDSHVHVGNSEVKISAENSELIAYKKYSPVTPEGYMRKALACGVSKAVIFPFPLMEIPFDEQNSYVMNAAQKFPYFFIPFLIPEPVEKIEKYPKDFAGIKDHFYFDFHNQINRNEILEYAQAYDKVYLFHAHKKHWNDRIKLISKNFPKLRVVVAHAGRPEPFSGSGLHSRLNEFKKIIPAKVRDNFFFETSTIRNSESIVALVNTFGDEHIIWGSDFPYYSEEKGQVLSEELKVIRDAEISDDVKEKIFEKNFRKLYQKEDVWVRQAMPGDFLSLREMLSQISESEQKFLALKRKSSLVENQMKSGRHMLVAETSSGSLVGFLRKSDRHNRSVMIEEVYVSPKARGQHIATKLINAITPSYESAEVKTFASNVAMNTILTRLNFIPKYSSKGTMISWKR